MAPIPRSETSTTLSGDDDPEPKETLEARAEPSSAGGEGEEKENDRRVKVIEVDSLLSHYKPSQGLRRRKVFFQDPWVLQEDRSNDLTWCDLFFEIVGLGLP